MASGRHPAPVLVVCVRPMAGGGVLCSYCGAELWGFLFQERIVGFCVGGAP